MVEITDFFKRHNIQPSEFRRLILPKTSVTGLEKRLREQLGTIVTILAGSEKGLNWHGGGVTVKMEIG